MPVGIITEARALRRVVDDTDAVRGESWPVRIYEPAKSELAGYPELGGQ